MRETQERTCAAIPNPKWIATAGVPAVVPVDLAIPDCPPSPKRLLAELLALLVS